MEILRASDFRPASFQATVYTPGDEFSAGLISRTLMPEWGDRFDGEPVIIPAVEGLPKDLPRITLRSKNNEWRCEIASARVNFFWRTPSFNAISPEVSDFYSDALSLVEDYLRVISPRVGRLAAVLTWHCFHDSPGLFLARHFCKDRWDETPLNRPSNFELHAHKQYHMADGFDVNSWVRSKTARVSIENETRSIVLIEQDINTLNENLESSNFTLEQRRAFFDAVGTEFSQILRLYYPEKSKE